MSHKRRIQTSTTIMKTLKQHIDEALKIGNNLSEWSAYSCQPKTNKELKKIIEERISKEGTNCDLNDIDVSQITNMSDLFYNSEFNGDISKWDVSNVKEMWCTFSYSKFNGDISNWDVSNVENMRCMFYNAEFNQDISKWDTSKVEDMYFMFDKAKFNHDISNWKININCNTTGMFKNCHIKEEYKPKLSQS